MNHIFTIATSFEEWVLKIIINNRLGGKIEVANLEPETMIENKNDEIKSYHMKNIDSLDMKTSSIRIYRYNIIKFRNKLIQN